MTVNPKFELSLPDTRSIENSGMREDYSRFLAQLQVVANGNVILSDPYFFSIDTEGINES